MKKERNESRYQLSNPGRITASYYSGDGSIESAEVGPEGND